MFGKTYTFNKNKNFQLKLSAEIGIEMFFQAFQNFFFWNNKCGTYYIISLLTLYQYES